MQKNTRKAGDICNAGIPKHIHFLKQAFNLPLNYPINIFNISIRQFFEQLHEKNILSSKSLLFSCFCKFKNIYRILSDFLIFQKFYHHYSLFCTPFQYWISIFDFSSIHIFKTFKFKYLAFVRYLIFIFNFILSIYYLSSSTLHCLLHCIFT